MVPIRLPIDDTIGSGTPEQFVLGAAYGYTLRAGGLHYWPGREIWLPERGANALAMLRGTVHFVRAWQPIPPTLGIAPERTATEPVDPLLAMGDALVLRPLPAELARLADLLPSDAPLPKQIVYHNIDGVSAQQTMKDLINANQALYQPFFKAETDSEDTGELDPDGNLHRELFERRVDAEIETRWSAGQGPGILVEAGDVLGGAAIATAPPADSGITLPPEPPVPGTPATWRTLTMSLREADGGLFSLSYLLYLVYSDEEEHRWDRPEMIPDGLVAGALEDVASLPLVEVSTQLRADWRSSAPSEPPDGDMPPGGFEVRLKLTASGAEHGVSVLVDPHRGHLWRAQSKLPPAEYQVSCRGTLAYRECAPDAPALNARVETDPPPEPAFRIGLTPASLIKIDRRFHFLVGVNYEAVRRKNHHDLARNEIQAVLHNRFNQGWVDVNDGHAANPDREPPMSSSEKWREIAWDLESIRATGASVIRVWAFEGLEGLRFSFGPSQLLAEKLLADSPSGSPRLRRANMGTSADPDWIYACTEAEYAALKAHWGGPITVIGLDDRLLANAARLQQLASSKGLWVLWTLWTHFAEGGGYWDDFVAAAGLRLPFGLWVYRDVMIDPVARESYMNNALFPFVEFMESDPGDPALGLPRGRVLGYELVNECDIMWSGTQHRWAHTAQDRTHIHYLLDGSQVRTFVRESAETVRDVVAAHHGGDRDRRLILSGVLGSDPWRTRNELNLLDPSWSPNVRLSASAVTRYAIRSDWEADFADPVDPDATNRAAARDLVNRRSPRGTHDVAQTPWLRQHGPCLYIEAGDDPYEPNYQYGDCSGHRDTIRALLWAAKRKNYAGVFIWHFNNPRRDAAYATNPDAAANALTERLVNGGWSPAVSTHSGHNYRFGGGRPACERIYEFANDPQIQGLLLPSP